MSKLGMLYGSPLLIGDNRIPGAQYTPELEAVIPKIVQACLDFGLDPYPPIVELLTYDQIAEVAAYGGFPVRYPHWSFGMEYEDLSRGYEFGQYKIYEMVVNTNPSLLYCLASNTMLDHVLVISHALGHSDFFKNNAWFEPTTENALNELADHSTRIRRYMDRWGREKVLEFIDWVMAVDDLIDFSAAWERRQIKDIKVRDSREYMFPRKIRLPNSDGQEHEYMKDWINDADWKQSEADRITRIEAMRELNMFGGKGKDIMGYLLQHAPLNHWQQDILAMLYRETQYFAPQPLTKMLNEGWASYVDFNIMARQHWAGGDGVFDYAKHKAGVLGGKYSMNPYSVGFKLFLHIEERWNKGRFGPEYERCTDMDKKRNWDTKAGKGREQVFQVRAVHNDLTAIHEYVDQDFIDKYEIYLWEKRPSPRGGTDYVIKSKDIKDVKRELLAMYANGGRPDIRLANPNYGGSGLFLMEHQYEGRILDEKYARGTLAYLWCIWNNGGSQGSRPVAVTTRDTEGNEMVFVCTGRSVNNTELLKRTDFEKKYSFKLAPAEAN